MPLPLVLRLAPTLPHVCAHRSISQKYIRPFPRPYRRRLYEAVVKPQLPDELTEERELLTKNKVFAFRELVVPDPFAYSPFDLAEVKMIKQWIVEEEFRLLAICQRLMIDDAALWLASNQFRLKGIELKTYSSKIMRKLFEKTPFDTLMPLLSSRHLCVMLAKDPDRLRTVVNESAKYNWIIPLTVSIDDRIFSMDEVTRVAKLSSLEDLRAETTQILAQIPQMLIRTLGLPAQHLTGSLDHISSVKGNAS